MMFCAHRDIRSTKNKNGIFSVEFPDFIFELSAGIAGTDGSGSSGRTVFYWQLRQNIQDADADGSFMLV